MSDPCTALLVCASGIGKYWLNWNSLSFVVPAEVPSDIQSSVLPSPVSRVKYNFEPTTVRLSRAANVRNGSGAPPPKLLAPKFVTIVVPAYVLSLVQSWLPCTRSLARKYSSPLKLTKLSMLPGKNGSAYDGVVAAPARGSGYVES